MTDLILSLNAGSASLKFGLYRHEDGMLAPMVRGLAEGLSGSACLRAWDGADEPLFSTAWTAAAGGPDHAGAFERLVAALARKGVGEVSAVAHRIVHGGERPGPTMISPDVEAELDALSPLAPLHQPVGLSLYRLSQASFAHAVHVACFDTAFHSRMPEAARRLPLPHDLAAEGVRRYGFHGLSYAHTLRRLRDIDPGLAAGRIVAAHLGAGASLCAMDGEGSCDTTMGFSTLDGLMMATRCGSLDPGVVLHLLRREGMSVEAVEDLLYRRSGLLGVSGRSGDLRDLLAAADDDAKAAVDLFVYRAVQGIGAMAATLGGLDGLVFTGGVGEHSAEVRARICRRLDWLGVDLDPEANRLDGERRIDARTSCVSVWVIPADEEAEMARQTAEILWPRTPLNSDSGDGLPPERVDELLDEALEETFPASDPPAVVQPHDLEDLRPVGKRD